MASGHEYRANRPNTWLLRPMLQREDSPCQPGAVHTWPIATFRCKQRFGRFRRILLKKSKMPRQQNLRKSDLIAGFGWRCPLIARGKPLNEFAHVEAVPYVPQQKADQRLLENWSQHRRGFFQHNRREADINSRHERVSTVANDPKRRPTRCGRHCHN